MHYDIREDAESVEKNYTARKNGFGDVAFVLTVVTLATAAVAMLLA